MFPINLSTVLYLSWVGIFLLATLAFRSHWALRLPLVLAAVGIPVALLWSDPPSGQYSGLGYLIVIGPALGAFLVGAVFGAVIKRVARRPVVSIGVPTGICGAVTILLLWNQYVPAACLGTPLQVNVAGQTLAIPPEMRPRLEDESGVTFFGRMDRKSDYAGLCRRGSHGERALDFTTVWISPVGNHDEMTEVCSGDPRPAWCGHYSAKPYRHIGKILIAPDTDPGFPLPYWDGGHLQTDRQGDLREGSVCLLPEEGSVTECWIWAPFGEGARLTVSTSNLDAVFAGMPVQEAREMALEARDMTLNIMAQSER